LSHSEYDNCNWKIVLGNQIMLQKDEGHDKEVCKTSVFVCHILNMTTAFRKQYLRI
jgi:hypothetical protein